MERLVALLVVVAVVTGIGAVVLQTVPFQFNTTASVSLAQGSNPNNFAFVKTTTGPIDAGSTFYGNLTLYHFDPYAQGSNAFFYILTPDQYSAWVPYKGPPSGYYQGSRIIYNQINDNTTMPFNLKSNTTTTYYFVVNGNLGYPMPDLYVYEHTLASPWWTNYASLILGVATVIAGTLAGLVSRKQ